MRNEIIANDHAQTVLVKHLQDTEVCLRAALRRVDPKADCQICPAADLGIPYDVIRLAGGFATGCVVDWSCRVPAIPIDITMNIDTSSIFWLSGASEYSFSEHALRCLKASIDERSSYEWNFNGGNHFITHARASSGDDVLIIHSNEKEFKNQYNGLFPEGGNWYSDDIVCTLHSGKPLRLLVGSKAELFAQTARMLEGYNIVRHRFVAEMLTGKLHRIVRESHNHHYYMPTFTSAAIGCFVLEPGDCVPIFSTVGEDILMFRAIAGGANAIALSGGVERLIVPHGWGMTLSEPAEMVYEGGYFCLNGGRYLMENGNSLFQNPKVVQRSFPLGQKGFIEAISDHTPGEIVEVFEQVSSYSRHGFVRHC